MNVIKSEVLNYFLEHPQIEDEESVCFCGFCMEEEKYKYSTIEHTPRGFIVHEYE